MPPGGSPGLWRFLGAGFWGLTPPGFAFVPNSLGPGCELCARPFWEEEVQETKVRLLSVCALPSLMFSGRGDGDTHLGVSLVYPWCKCSSLSLGSRRPSQAAEVREEKGQNQIPQWGWSYRRKFQSEDLRRAFLIILPCPRAACAWLGRGHAPLALSKGWDLIPAVRNCWVPGKCREGWQLPRSPLLCTGFFMLSHS